MVIQPSGAAYNVALNQLVKLYFEPEEEVRIVFGYRSDDPASNAKISLQGYYVDVP